MKAIVIEFDEKMIDKQIALNTIHQLIFPVEIKSHWVKEIRLDEGDYKKGFNAVMEYWDSLNKEQQENLNKELKALGL